MASAVLLALRIALVPTAMVALACKDEGLVGVESSCETACDDDEFCYEPVSACVECFEDAHCAVEDDEDDDVDERAEAYCVDYECEECRSDADCGIDAPSCVAGSCGGCGTAGECRDAG